MDWARSASAVKQVNGTGALSVARNGAARMYRPYIENEDLTRNGGDVAREVLAQCEPADIVLLYEEMGQTGDPLRRHTQFLKEAAPVVHAAGKLLAGYGFSTSFPREADISYLVSENWGDCDILVMNEYWGLKGVPLEQRFTPYNALKHRVVHELSNGKHPPIWIGECGRDYVRDGDPNVNEGIVGKGYELDDISDTQMVVEFMFYEFLLQQDDYVVAANAFTVGATPDWQAKGFDLDKLAHRLALPFTPQMEYIRFLYNPVSGPVVPPTPPGISNGGNHMATLKQVLDDIEAKGLAGQITLNAGKKAASYTEQGTQVDATFSLFGDIVNLAREAKKALETPIPV